MPIVISAFLKAQWIKNPPAMWEAWARSLGQEGLLLGGVASLCSVLDWRIRNGRRSLAAAIPVVERRGRGGRLSAAHAVGLGSLIVIIVSPMTLKMFQHLKNF